MSRSGGMGQLTKGIVIGIVLLLAIVGTMSIFEKAKNNKNPLSLGNNTARSNTSEVAVPSINVNTPQVSTEDKVDGSAENDAINNTIEKNTKTKIPLEKEDSNQIVETKKSDSIENKSNFTPILENERVLREKPIKKPKFGLLQVSAINPNNKKSLLASFVVFNNAGKKVAEAKAVKKTSFRLPVGKYKVVSTLVKSNSSRRTQSVQSSKTIRLSANKKTSRVFKLEPPSTLGVLQVSAKSASTGKAMKADYIIQKENGKTIATRSNVSHTLFKLKAGSYKVTVKSGKNSDFRTIVVEPGESTKEIFKLQETIKQGQLLVRVFDTRTSKPIRANIVITTSNGTSNGITVQQLKDVSRTEISLPTGRYKIRVTGPNGQSSKNITISAGQKTSEVFRFDAPQNKAANEVQITENVRITPPRVTQPVIRPTIPVVPEKAKPKPVPKVKGSLKLFARNDGNNVPLKSNFYVQLPNGKNIAKKVYSNSAQFLLEPGVYKITVRSKNRKNIVKTVRVSSGQSVTEVFSLISTLPKPQPKPQKVAQAPVKVPAKAPVLAPQKPAKPSKPKPAKTAPEPPIKVIPNGFLSVAMKPPRKTHFIVATRSGRKIVELTSVPSARFKLDTGQYLVTAIQNKRRRTKNITVRANKTTHINFNAVNFQAPRNNQRNATITNGVLRSRIINPNGQALRGTLTVTNSRGQVVARANSVTVGVFDLPAGPYTIILNYRGLRGSERVNIRPQETTMQTFTVAPNQSNQPRPVQQDPRNIMRERIERETRRRF